MSGKAPSEAPKPQAPKKIAGIKVTLVPRQKPVVEDSAAASLTVLPSSTQAIAEDKGPQPTYEGITQRTGMFQRVAKATTATKAIPSGSKPKPTVAKKNVSRPLMANEEEDDENENYENDFENEAPMPPPEKPLKKVVPETTVLPRVAQEYLGLKLPKEKSYALDAVQRRITDEIADILITLEDQIDEIKLGSIDFDTREGFKQETDLVDGKTKYTMMYGQSFTDPLTDEKLAKLDDLFKTLRIRLNYILGSDSLDDESETASDLLKLFKYIEYAKKFKKEKPQILAKRRDQYLNEMMTDSMADTLLALEEQLEELDVGGAGIQTMTLKSTDPTVYEFTDGSTLLPAETEEEKKEAEKRLEELDPLFEGGTKIRLTKVMGTGRYNLEGSPLQVDWSSLAGLFKKAQEFKSMKKEGKQVAATVAVAETLEGTPYNALAKPIEAEMSKAPYEVTTTSDYRPGKYKDKEGRDAVLPKQTGFIPQTRRAFGYFIYDKYRRYMLKALEKLDPNACAAMGSASDAAQIYEYQKFVRDYVSFMTPYRGVLVYHGLGSGKTCTAIAASEALLSTGGKKRIIVMTPFSLRKNFIQQITFCGFRHYRLLNYWTPHEYKMSDGQNALWLFATSVLRIPESYLMSKKGMRIWIPDLNKAQNEENYSRLPAEQQAEIRNQIYNTLVYMPHKDPKKRKNGLIWFISYNGITAKDLKDLACEKGAFDNAVIVVDEIHNLVRLMQGTIDPYLKKITLGDLEFETRGDKKYLDPDRIMSEGWKPKYCNRSMNYKRGYLFYRLLVGAKNTKIVGLSGTPLINFPEELGILANVLHGYNFTFKATLNKRSEKDGNKRLQEGLKKMSEGQDSTNFCPDLDFYEVVIDDVRGKIEYLFTFLPEGYRKIQGQLGVERIPFDEVLETTEQKLTKVKGCITKVIKTLNPNEVFDGPIVEKAEPLLPVMGEPSNPTVKQLDDSFKGRFINPADGVSIVNEQILMKRLSGLISYYKGSRKDLMPEVTEDVVVKVPMSLDQQKKYIAIRLAEIKVEEQKEKAAKRGGPEARGDDAEVKKLSSSQNYRMASRQACNFVFPDGFTRPRPQTAEEAKQADEFGGTVEELYGEEEAPETSALVGTAEEEEEEREKAEQEAKQAQQDDLAVSQQEEADEIEAKKKELAGKAAGEIQAAIEAIKARYEIERQGGLLLANEVEEETDAATTTTLSKEQKECLANMLPNESYQSAINRSKRCLLNYGLSKLLLKDPQRPSESPLGRWSPKYKAILENIQEIPGSSLVYSQFLGMEGIGIFTIAMQANGYEPIRIVSRDGKQMFDEETEASIRKGPTAGINRFILFTGGESDEIRKINIDLFNAKYSELPSKIQSVLAESGFTDAVGNKKGELCRVFCITSAGAEGLSLKNVRGVHIMEPYWNDVRMAQVKGRAVRICSHMDLPLKERTVQVYTYVSVFSGEAQIARGDPREGERMRWAIPQEIWNRDGIPQAVAQRYGISTTRDLYAMTSDERLYYISEQKKKLVENLVIIMKTAAADCLLNYKENMDGTFICRLLGNEGDFLYHPNLQKDIETSKADSIGDIFKVPEAQLQEVREAQAKLRFEEEEEEAKEEEKEEKPVVPTLTAAEAAVATKEEAGVTTVKQAAPLLATTTTVKQEAPVLVTSATVKQEAPLLATSATTTATTAAVKRVSYPVKIAGNDYMVSALPDATGKVDKFFIYAAADKTFTKKLGTAEAEYDAPKKRWIPKRGTAKLG